MKIIFKKTECIGCGSCVSVCENLFEMDEDGKSHLKNSKIDKNTEQEELELKDIDCAKEAIEVCPVKCICILK